jgi:hypothetical protein
MSETPNRLTPEQARQRAAECRLLAKHAIQPSHRIILDHMAETWERIAGEVHRDH